MDMDRPPLATRDRDAQYVQDGAAKETIPVNSDDGVERNSGSVLYGVEDVPSAPVCFLFGLQVHLHYTF